jgi:hypothetical protein
MHLYVIVFSSFFSCIPSMNSHKDIKRSRYAQKCTTLFTRHGFCLTEVTNTTTTSTTTIKASAEVHGRHKNNVCDKRSSQ